MENLREESYLIFVFLNSPLLSLFPHIYTQLLYKRIHHKSCISVQILVPVFTTSNTNTSTSNQAKEIYILMDYAI